MWKIDRQVRRTGQYLDNENADGPDAPDWFAWLNRPAPGGNSVHMLLQFSRGGVDRPEAERIVAGALSGLNRAENIQEQAKAAEGRPSVNDELNLQARLHNPKSALPKITPRIAAKIYRRQNGEYGASCDGTADTGHAIQRHGGKLTELFTVRSIHDDDRRICTSANRAAAERAIAEDWRAK